MARYLERAASLARVIEMHSSFGSQVSHSGWSWLLTLHADEEQFRECNEPTSASVIAFYVTDIANPSSIRSSIHWARENARALRSLIPLEMWVHLNTLHSAVEALALDTQAIGPTELPRTCARIRAGCLAQIGIADGTLYRDEGYHFFRLGLSFERADQTSRLLDVKFAQGRAAETSRGVGDNFVFWSTILRTADAYQVFHRLEAAAAEPERVARFLILAPAHPRSIGYCVHAIDEALQALRGPFRLSGANAALKTCEVLTAGLQAAGEDEALLSRLHEFNDWVQLRLIQLTNDISSAFFTLEPKGKKASAQRSQEAQTMRDQRQQQWQS